MYSVGDKVVHPMHGAGTIEEIKEIEIVGKKRQYYVLKFAIGNMVCLLYTSPSPRDISGSRMPSSA